MVFLIYQETCGHSNFFFHDFVENRIVDNRSTNIKDHVPLFCSRAPLDHTPPLGSG